MFRSDKATVEITSPFKGRVIDLAGAVGDILKVGGKLCQVEVDDGTEQVVNPEATDCPKASTSPSLPASISSSVDPVTNPPPPLQQTSWSTGVLATPATRRMARESSISLSEVPGTGKDGRVTKSDVLDFLASSSNSTSPTPKIRPPLSTSSCRSSSSASTSDTSSSTKNFSITSIPLSPVRKAMFRAMTSTLQIPHFAYTETIDVTRLESLRQVINSNIPLKYRRTLRPSDELELQRLSIWTPSVARVSHSSQYDRITLLPLLLKSLSSAMSSHPLFLCTLTPDQQLLRRASHDISLALSGPTGGLYTPLLPSVESLSPYELASKLANLQSLAIASTPPKFPEENKGSGTITLSNVGVVGGRSTHPIIPPTGQLAIGAIGRTRVVPMYVGQDLESARGVALTGGDSSALRMEPRLLMVSQGRDFINSLDEKLTSDFLKDVTFSADHRVVEGVELARLVDSWKRIIEAPEQLIGLGQ
ncbi:hypothetical protein P7C70_g299, partial [Phenoliferia sp. Uapishka_3]